MCCSKKLENVTELGTAPWDQTVMVLALKLSETFSGILCSIHILQRAVVTVLNTNGFTSVRKCVNVSKSIHKSLAKKDLLKQACREVNCDCILPKIPVSTRWNSLFYCIKSVLKLNKKWAGQLAERILAWVNTVVDNFTSPQSHKKPPCLNGQNQKRKFKC